MLTANDQLFTGLDTGPHSEDVAAPYLKTNPIDEVAGVILQRHNGTEWG